MIRWFTDLAEVGLELLEGTLCRYSFMNCICIAPCSIKKYIRNTYVTFRYVCKFESYVTTMAGKPTWLIISGRRSLCHLQGQIFFTLAVRLEVTTCKYTTVIVCTFI